MRKYLTVHNLIKGCRIKLVKTLAFCFISCGYGCGEMAGGAVAIDGDTGNQPPETNEPPPTETHPHEEEDCVNVDNDFNPDGSPRCDGVWDPITHEGLYMMFHESIVPAGTSELYLYGYGFGQDPAQGNDWCDPRHQFQVGDAPTGRWFRMLLPDVLYYVNGGTVDVCENGVPRHELAFWFDLRGEPARTDEMVWLSEAGDGLAICTDRWEDMRVPGDCSAIDDISSH